jgi:hypothetical protein
MEEIKAILESLVSNCLKASNASDEEKDKEDKDKKAENKKACNEDVDKRDIIRQIMAIAGKEEASEDVRTIAKLAEKLAYDKSEAGTADNSKKAKNEDDEEEDDKEAANKKAKNEEEKEEKKEVIEEKDEKAENKKACNSADIDKAVNDILAATNAQSAPKYETQADRLKLGEKY